MKELNNARESKQDCLREWFQTAGRGGQYDRLQGPIQQAAEADTASRSFNISLDVKFQMFNFKSECQMKGNTWDAMDAGRMGCVAMIQDVRCRTFAPAIRWKRRCGSPGNKILILSQQDPNLIPIRY